MRLHKPPRFRAFSPARTRAGSPEALVSRRELGLLSPGRLGGPETQHAASLGFLPSAYARAVASRRHPAELQQREHLALRFGLVLRRDAGELARRERTDRATAAALAVPYYALIHHGNVVPRQALAQRGRLDGVVAVRLPGSGAASAVGEETEVPIAVREDPATTWRWLVPLREQSSHEEFAELHRRMSSAVLTALVGAPQRDLAPLESAPDRYVP